jgi:hypothetical protein
MPAILLVDENGHRHTFKTVQSTAQHIRQHKNGWFTVYTAADVFAKIKALTVDIEDAEDHEAIQGYRAWKSEASSWGDVDDLNDMMDSARARIRARAKRLVFGGETYEPPSRETSSAVIEHLDPNQHSGASGAGQSGQAEPSSPTQRLSIVAKARRFLHRLLRNVD